MTTTTSSRIELRDRRRRRREESERQILDAAEGLLRERPYRDLTVDDVMAAAGQSRTAFYRHFKDRQDLVTRLLGDLAAELFETASSWLAGSGDPLVEGRQATARLVDAWAPHGPLLRAIAEAASHDDEVERVYRGLVQAFVDATVDRLRRDVAAGRAVVPDIPETASALCWMTERYLTMQFGRPGSGDPANAAEVLHAIWMRAVYRLDPTT
ncbi:MAG TPA: TetR/AcrR family transcriptional regulator [Actinomycetes bacterium]|nr:TetR/AcrR family transcriptional regulator [Actinomycetes bacterium]